MGLAWKKELQVRLKMGRRMYVYHLEKALAAVLALVHTYIHGERKREKKIFRHFWHCRSHDNQSAVSKYRRESSCEDGKWLSVADK